MNKKIIITASLLVLVLAAIGGWTFSGAGNTIYYTQIDNDKIEPGGKNGGVVDLKGDMDYYYTPDSLRCLRQPNRNHLRHLPRTPPKRLPPTDHRPCSRRHPVERDSLPRPPRPRPSPLPRPRK